METPTILDTALTLHHAGISVVPVAADGTKRPALPWARLQKTPPVTTEIRSWFHPGHTYGLGAITGTISGNLELTEIEGHAAHHIPTLEALAHDSGLGHLWKKLNTGWVELSPSGGVHWLYHLTDPVPGNTKIARQGNTVIAETRGEGGYVVLAPSHGPVHTTGKPWIRIAGGPNTAPTLTTTERAAFHTLLATLGDQPEPVRQDPLPALTPPDPGDGTRPGDDYEAKTPWADILEPHGWTAITHKAGTTYWRRPGKTTPGFSATTGHAPDRDRLYVFSTSTAFEPETPYTKFGAYALLEHDGNHRAAARALKAKGHGSPPSTEEIVKLRRFNLVPEITPEPNTAPASTTGAALATVTHLPARLSTGVTMTDHGNAMLFIETHGKQIRYTPSRGKWLQWDGIRWAVLDDDGPIIERCWKTIEAIHPTDNAEKQHKHRSLSRRSLEATAVLAKRDTRIRTSTSQLDAHPLEINTPGGIVDLTNGTLKPHDPARMHTKTTLITPDQDQPTPLWDRLLNYAFEDKPETVGYIQNLVGYAATGHVTHHILPFLYGSGGNGKSVFLDTITAILGDYATSAPAGFLMAGREQHETEIARLAGTRLVVCSEVNQRDRFDEAKVKLLTGGDKLTARFMRQDHFTFTPTHTLFMMGNHQPRVESGGGESFWRRLRLLPFTRIVPEQERIDNLTQRLLAEEAGGILAWIIQGAINVHQGGLITPEAVLRETRKYADEEDALARFAADHLHIGGGHNARVNTAHLRTAYSAWCRQEGETELPSQLFGRELRTRFDVSTTRSNGRRFYTNLTLLSTDDLDEEQQNEHWLDRVER